MITSTRTLTVLGLAGIAIGIPVWIITGNGVIGAVLVGVGVLVLALAAFGRQQHANDPETRLHNQRADQHRLDDETAAGAENLEDRPPPTGG